MPIDGIMRDVLSDYSLASSFNISAQTTDKSINQIDYLGANLKTNMLMSFQEKLEYSQNLIKEALKEHQYPIIACSFGKDSVAVLHLVRSITDKFKVLWNNTLVEYPETYQFARSIIKDWDLDCIEAKPKKTFWDIVEEYGFPVNARNAKGEKQVAAAKCCNELKKKPTRKALRETECDLYFTGLTRHESRLREFSARKYGDYFYSTKWKHWKCHPILNWTTDDVWEYHKTFNMPHNPLYDMDEVSIDGGIRTGCWPCPQAIKYGKLEHLRNYYPKLFDLLVIKKGLGELIFELRINKFKNIHSRAADYMRNCTYQGLGVEKTLATHPCFFDRV